MDDDPILKEDILNDLAGISNEKKKNKKKPKKKAKHEEEEMTDDEKRLKLEQLDARAFKANINKNYEDALDFYNQIIKIDPEFKNIKQKRKECMEKAGGEKKPKPKKKKKKKKK